MIRHGGLVMENGIIKIIYLAAIVSMFFFSDSIANAGSGQSDITNKQSENFVFNAEKLTSTELSNIEAKGNFPGGYCTYYADQQVKNNWGKKFNNGVPWRGDAYEWWSNSKSYKNLVKRGDKPKVGSIVVYDQYWGGASDPQGHVAYVTKKDGRNFTVTEMNVKGFWKISTRKDTTKNNNKILGFISKK
jgi:surface antigen